MTEDDDAERTAWIQKVIRQRDKQLEEGVRLRQTVLAAHESGLSMSVMAKHLGVSAGALSYWIKVAIQERDGTSASPRRGGRRS